MTLPFVFFFLVPSFFYCSIFFFIPLMRSEVYKVGLNLHIKGLVNLSREKQQIFC